MKTLATFQLAIFSLLLLMIVHDYADARQATVPTRTREGGMSSGGGGAFVLRDASEKVLKAELLDLWEAKHVASPKIEIEYSDLPVQKQVLGALEKLKEIDSLFYSQSLKALAYLQDPKNIDDKADEVEINPPEDAKNKYRKRGWPLEGMYLFDGDTKKLSRKKEIYDALITNTDKAASWVHEAVYMVLRDKPSFATDSVLARRLTACLFSKTPCLPSVKTFDAIPTDREVFYCESPGADFYFYRLREILPAEYWTFSGQVIYRALLVRSNKDLSEGSEIRTFGVETYLDMGFSYKLHTTEADSQNEAGIEGGGLTHFGFKLFNFKQSGMTYKTISEICKRIR